MTRKTLSCLAVLALAVLLPLDAAMGGFNHGFGHRFQSAGALGNPDSAAGVLISSTPDRWLLLETLFHPVAFSPTKAGVTVSVVPKEAKTLRLAYRKAAVPTWTTLAKCWKDRRDALDTKDVDGTCNASAFERVDFVLCDPNDPGTPYDSCLDEDTNYIYRVEELIGSNWVPRSTSNFWTIDTDPDATQRFAFISDEHISQGLAGANCSLVSFATGDSAGVVNWFQTLSNLKFLQGSRKYRAYLSSGDTFMTHGLNYTDNPCTFIEGISSGGCGYLTPCSGSNINSVTTQTQADMRVLFTLQIMQPVLRLLPFVFTCGNHDPCGFKYAEDHGTVISSSASEHWYLDASNNINVYTMNAMHRFMPNPEFTYGDVEGHAKADADGRWYSFMMGPAEIVVLCAECGAGEDPAGVAADGDLDQDGTPWEAPNLLTVGEGDFPGNVDGWNDWYPGRDQCNYMTGSDDCTGTAGRLRDDTWDANTDGDDNEGTTTGEVFDIFYKFTLRHHVFGSTTQTLSGKWYGRGGQGAVERFCDADGTTKCSHDGDCISLSPQTCPDYTGLEDLNGWEDEIQRELEAFTVAVGGKSYAANLLGHDHLSNAGVKFTAGPTNTHVAFVHGTQPSGGQDGPGWADNVIMIEASDWGGDDNSPDGVPDYCDSASVEAINIEGGNFYACHDLTDDSVLLDQGGLGSLIRGFLDVEMVGKTALNIKQVATVHPSYNAVGFSLLNMSELWMMTLAEDQGAPSGDTTAPVILTGPSVNVTSYSTATITWTTDDDATSRVLYALFPFQPTSGTTVINTPAGTNGVQSHSVDLNSLLANAQYNFQVETTNEAGLTTFSSIGSFTTPPASPPGGGGSSGTVELLDLEPLFADRMPLTVAPFDQTTYLAAAAWPTYDVTCASGSCPSGKLPLNHASFGYTGAVPNVAANTSDIAAVNAIIAAAPQNSRLYFPNGTYDGTTSATHSGGANGYKINRSNIVLECESEDNTKFLVHNVGKGFNCRDEFGTNNANLCGALLISVSTPNMWTGSKTNWTGGFTRGTQSFPVQDASIFQVGDWALMRASDGRYTQCSYIDETANAGLSDPLQWTNHLNHAGIVTAVDTVNNTISLDRPIEYDYPTGADCGVKTATKVTPIENIGIEGCGFDVDTASIASSALDKDSAVRFGAVANSWMVGNKFTNFYNQFTSFRLAWRNWFQGNDAVDNLGDEFNMEGIHIANGSPQNVLENNYGLNNRVWSKTEASGAGNVFAYNYLLGPTSSIPQNSIFLHGRYSTALIEGNDVDTPILAADHYWGRNGPYITLHRNRNSRGDGGKYDLIYRSRDKCEGAPGFDLGNFVYFQGGCQNSPTQIAGSKPQWPIASFMNWIGNTANFFATAAICNTPPCNNQYNNIGYLSGGNDIWYKNRYTRASGGLQLVGSYEDTTVNCGTGLGGCPGTNVQGSTPESTYTSDQIPPSLYDPGDPPSWWCQEACPWTTVHGSIGQWGDNYSTTLCKLPAQIRAEGGTCTACGAGGAGC